MPDGYYLTPETKDRLDRLLNARPVSPTAAARTPRARSVVLVRCDDTTAADTLTGSVGADCYPGTVILGEATVPIADLEDGDPVWLSLTDGSVPEADMIYTCVLAGDVEIGGELLPRAFAQPAGAGAGASLTAYVDALNSTAGNSTGFEVWNSEYAEVPGPGDYLVLFMGQATYTAGTNTTVQVAVTHWDDGDPIPDAADSIPIIGVTTHNFPAAATPANRMVTWIGQASIAGTGPQRVGVVWDVTGGTGWAATGPVMLTVIPVTANIP